MAEVLQVGGQEQILRDLLAEATLDDVRAALKLRESGDGRMRWMLPDVGPHRRELYPKHLRFLELGKTCWQRMFLAGNRTGKSELGAFETACHVTGLYPDWWPGWRTECRQGFWACGTTTQTVKDSIQAKLLGVGSAGGMIPKALIKNTIARPNTGGGIDVAYIKHASGRTVTLGFKSYEQGRTAFEAVERDGIWMDEEPPEDVYDECLTRLATTKGRIYNTVTPLQGVSKVVQKFLPNGDPELDIPPEGCGFVGATMDDVPHLDRETIDRMVAAWQPYQREARRRGVPSLGSGAIYPVPEGEFVVEPFVIPDEWPCSFGMDVGWNRTAAVFGTQDPISRVYYVFAEHYQGEASPAIHAQGIKAKRGTVPGVIDPASRGRSQVDGIALANMYRELGLQLDFAKNPVEAGIQAVWEALIAGNLKVFRSCQNTIAEFRQYHRDEKGRIVKEKDHLMDALRYWFMSGRDKMRPGRGEGRSDLANLYGKSNDALRLVAAGGNGAGAWMN